jgi:hypothetical protein
MGILYWVKTNGEVIISLSEKDKCPPGLHEAIFSIINCSVNLFL